MKKVQIITVGADTYLGQLLADDKSVILSGSMPISGVAPTKSDLAEYIRKDNAGTLEKDTAITGNNVTYALRDLSDDSQDDFDILAKQFAKAEKIAVPKVVNAEFARLAGC